jgi:hypothetical protein
MQSYLEKKPENIFILCIKKENTQVLIFVYIF